MWWSWTMARNKFIKSTLFVGYQFMMLENGPSGGNGNDHVVVVLLFVLCKQCSPNIVVENISRYISTCRNYEQKQIRVVISIHVWCNLTFSPRLVHVVPDTSYLSFFLPKIWSPLWTNIDSFILPKTLHGGNWESCLEPN